jgi:DNA-binding transcriptional regulator/RsmH inhibitor MraZ
LDHKARLLGVGQKFELWSEDAYLAAENQDAAVGEGPAEHLAQLVI